MQNKRVPVRMCTGCKSHLPKRELVRVVKSPQGEIALDMTGKKPGRGAYVCRQVDCLKKARKTKSFERVFACQIPEEVYDRLEEEMQAGEE